MSETSANREAGRPLWKATALVLAMPALIACLDLLVRLQIAAVLQLNHDAAAQSAALRSSLLGVLKDLLLVMPAYGVLALVPCTATRRLTGIAIALAALILAADLAYFYFTLEHVEPVLFVNLNLLALAGTIELRSAASAGLAAIGTLALLWLNTRLVRGISADLARPALSILVLGACAFPLLPLAISTQPQMAHHDNEVEQFLDATRNASLKKLSAPILANFFTAAAASRQFEQAAAPIQSVPYTAQEAALLRDLRLLDAERRASRSRRPRRRRSAGS